jgi:pimeloyl-ACP methyl ester carboxylesterase
VQPSRATLANLWMSGFLSPAAAAEATVPQIYGSRCRRETPGRIASDLDHRRGQRIDANAYQGQIAAAMAHDAAAELHAIAVSTLVVHGAKDRLVPTANGALIAERIPGAQLHVVPDAGHCYPTDEPAAHGVVASFLANCA